MMEESLFNKLNESISSRKDVFLVTITDHPNESMIGIKALLWPNGHIYSESSLSSAWKLKLFESCRKLMKKQRSGTASFEVNEENVECFAEYFPAPIHLIIAGAGHVCEPVAELAKMLGFFVTIVDDRPEFANKQRFPYADEVHCQSFISFFREVALSENTYILLLTRGHQFDVISLQELLMRQEKIVYIGMIGSRRRISGVFKELQRDFPEDNFDHLYTPVGLDIGAESPSEIAISIMAEILKVKNQRSGCSLSNTIKHFAKRGFHEGAAKCNL